MKTRTISNDLSTMVNPHFYSMWWSNKPYIMCKGGRGSFKSSTISLKLVYMMFEYIAKGQRANVVCIRENQTYLHDSVYSQITWALNMLHVSDQFEFRPTRLKIVHKRTKSTFFFYGAKDPERLKSNIVNNVIALWYEEATNMDSKQVFDDVNPTFVRQKPEYCKQFKIFYSFNPKRNQYDWSNDWITSAENDPDWLVDHSTYLDDKLGITTPDTFKLISTVKRNDPDFYRWRYKGEVVGLGTNIYNMSLFNRLDKIPEDDHIVSLYFCADTGHAVSADAICALGVLDKRDKNGKPKVVLLDMYYYSPANKVYKKSPSDLSKDIKQFIDYIEKKYKLKAWKYTMDSAEAALRNQMYDDFGIIWHPVNKLREAPMIEYVQSLLSQGRFYYLPTENNLGFFIPQHQKYQWDEKTLHSDNPRVIKVDDHSVDAFKYGVLDNLQDFGLAY